MAGTDEKEVRQAKETRARDAFFVTRVGGLPCLPGAYALALELERPSVFETGVLGRVVLPAGRYLYLGSAWGPGGLRARVGRHFRAGKPLRWHIDHLTRCARLVGAFAVTGERECALVERLRRLPEVAVPLPRFGSTDCAVCPSHLLTWPAGLATGVVVRLFADRRR